MAMKQQKQIDIVCKSRLFEMRILTPLSFTMKWVCNILKSNQNQNGRVRVAEACPVAKPGEVLYEW